MEQNAVEREVLFEEWLQTELAAAGEDKEALRTAGVRGAQRFGRVSKERYMAMPHAMRTAFSRWISRGLVG